MRVALIMRSTRRDLAFGPKCAAEAMNVLFIDSGGHTDDVTGKNCTWNTFRVCKSTWMETHATGFDLAQRFGKKWHIITPDYAFGHSLLDGYTDVAKRIGVEITNDLVPLTLTDFSPYLTKVQGAKPSLFIVLVQGDQFVTCLKQAAAFGLTKSVPLGGPQVELEAVEALPPDARVGYWGVEWYYNSPLCVGTGDTRGRRFVADYKKKYNKTPSARSAFGYIAAGPHAVGHERGAKSTDAVKLARKLRGTRRSARSSRVKAYFRKIDHQLMWPQYIAEMRPNGTPKDKDDLFNVLSMAEADKIEQPPELKASICHMEFPG